MRWAPSWRHRGTTSRRDDGPHVRSPRVSEASSVLSPLLHDSWLTLAAGLIFLSLSSCGVGASLATCPALHDHDAR